MYGVGGDVGVYGVGVVVMLECMAVWTKVESEWRVTSQMLKSTMLPWGVLSTISSNPALAVSTVTISCKIKTHI